MLKSPSIERKKGKKYWTPFKSEKLKVQSKKRSDLEPNTDPYSKPKWPHRLSCIPKHGVKIHQF